MVMQGDKAEALKSKAPRSTPIETAICPQNVEIPSVRPCILNLDGTETDRTGLITRHRPNPAMGLVHL